MKRAGKIDRPAAVCEADGMQVWGGVECTCNRVGERYFDQMDLSGHAGRMEDYERFAELGMRTLRLGLLWERHELDPSWRWADQALRCLRQLGIRPIAGLVHHGSGPRHTSLLDPAFPEKLAAYARSVAERYPWLDAYTPVNEPNTTARFSAMYGVWYPHHMSRGSYLRALVHQVKGTVLAMRAIRQVRPDAQLIQTDDVGRIQGSDELRDTWELLNLRQWLTFDLLCGKVDRHHPLYVFMRDAGMSEADILWFADNQCPPSVVGVNYYLTSDRYLDERAHLYPEDRRSAEGPFADVEAVRVQPEGIAGVDVLLEEAWRRYRVPVAITEVHLGCTPEEQVRWLADCWDGAMRARDRGVPCVALTVWALLGSYFWNELVTYDNGHYEPGVFDMRSGSPEPTMLARAVAQMARGRSPAIGSLQQQGWWRQPSRICFPWRDEAAAPWQVPSLGGAVAGRAPLFV